ncbi:MULTISPECIES: P-loop NTPase [unclassified Oceanispirochaeta]|uniref:P-loop NTPase n=1 Tax=unclassified Oceanispirochaeta TaxID=2635722 RepID=UPI000E099052|nr:MULTISPECIES: P-loop NTPase [unclassified Oceanispirochaeta]MBF9016242.1 AAA family ATPase [Oceanispirochaeta sp. M2]NPD72704.1 AAA family ATPase [Oceanispirochaeta sp. M1]RDG31852.1 MinD/ParA family protein [Oceanispirochaeta sp. M1]
MVLNESLDKKIIPIAGGKGGVGKSVISVNLALSLAISDKRTIIIDLDMGGANLHTVLGMKNTNPGVASYLQDKNRSFKSLILDTPFKNLQFIPGDTLSYGMADITEKQKRDIIYEIQDLDADYIILDLGAGSSFNTIDFFLISNSGLIITTPQAGAVMNSYTFLKNLTIRFLQKAFASNKNMEAYLKKNIKRMLPGTNLTLAHLLHEIGMEEPETRDKALAYLEVLQPKVILNMMEEEDDFQMAENLSALVKKDLLIDMECLGAILFDRNVDDSLHDRHPFLLEYQDSLTAQQIYRIGQKIAQSRNFPELPLDYTEYRDSFELGKIETQNDFELYRQIKDTEGGNSGGDAVDVDQLMEVIEIQQQKIQELQQTVRMMGLGQKGQGGGGLLGGGLLGGGSGGGLFN